MEAVGENLISINAGYVSRHLVWTERHEFRKIPAILKDKVNRNSVAGIAIGCRLDG
jgi:hypothetical protein